MEPTIPVHYHQLPLITGTDIVYEEALPLWDMNAKRIVVGDGVTPGGVLIPNFNDDLSYVRKFILADTTAATKDWLICTTSLTVNLPSDVSAMAVVRISTLADAEPVTVKAGDTVVLSMGSSTTVELVYGESGWVITENTSAASDMGDYLKKEALMLNGAAAQLVSFKSMTQAAYDLITPVIDAIYFIRDTGKLIFNGVVYGSGGGGGGEAGVSTYLYVAYAAGDTGAGFSLVPTDDLPYRAEIHVHVEIQNPALSDFADAVWIKYIATGGGSGEGGTPSQAFTKTDVTVESTGDNQNAAYLTLSTLLTVVGILDNEGVQWNLPSGAVKRADNSTVVDISSVLADKGITADNIADTWYVLFAAGEGGSSGGSVSWGDVTGKPSTYPPAAHTHEISQVDGLQDALDNAGKVKSVNGQLPDESGNVTVETGGVVDESRLLPVLDTLPEGYEGSLLAVQRGDGKVADENTLRLMHFNDDVRDVVTDETGTLKGNASITPTGYFSGALSINSNVISSLIFNGLSATPNVWTMDFRVKLAAFSGDAPQILCGTNLNETQTSLIRVSSSRIDIQATYNQHVIYQEHSLQLNVWYHFALTYDGTTYKFYIDGELFGSGESENHFDFTRKLWFGSFYDYSTSYVSNCTIDEFRLSDVVRWTENFTPPDAPYGESLYNWGIGPKLDESRLLPTGGRNGNLLEYQEGVDRGNNVNTKLLLQPATSDGLIVDQAAGNAAPVSITNSGNVVIEDNALVFTGTNSLLIPANALGMTLGGNNEFMIDIEFQLDSVKSDYATLYGSDGGGSGYQGALYFTSGGAAHFTMGLGPTTTGWTLGTKHRITIERWNDNGTWKTSVYRNGSFLASSTSGMNTLSDYVFPIGSNNEGTGRNFVGKIWAFRISNKAEHRGVSFTPRELPFLPPAGQPVWTEGIDRSRLLPENPANGDIPCFDATATVGGGNDAHTRLLLQPSTSDHGIVDQAAGNAAPVTLENHNVTVDEEGNMVFDGSNAYLKIPANTLPSDFFNGTDEWTLDIVYNVTSKNRQCLFGCSRSLRMDFLLDSDGSLQIGGGPNLGTGWPFNEDVHLTFEIYKDGTVWKYTIFRNGSVVTTGTWVNADWRSVAQYVGWEGETGSRKINGKIKALRLTSGALHKGAAFQSDYPWTRPQTVGEWGKFNKSELKATRVRILSRDPSTRLVVVQPLRLRNGVWETDPNAPEKTVKY